MRQRGVFPVGVDLFDDCALAVDLVRGHGVEGCGGEEGVEPVRVEQGRVGKVLLVQFRDSPHREAPGDVVFLRSGGECGEGDLVDLGFGDPGIGAVVEDRVGVVDRRPGGLGNHRDRAFDGGVLPRGDRYVSTGKQGHVHCRKAVVGAIGPQQHRCRVDAGQSGDGLQRVGDDPGSTSRGP